MIQSFNEKQTFLYKNEEIPLTWQSGDVSFYFKLDSKNTIFRFKYSCPDSQKSYFEFLGEYLQDKSVEGLNESICHNTYALLDKKETEFDEFTMDLCLTQLRSSLAILKGDFWTSPLDAQNIICRCMKVDLQMFNALFDEHKGHKKKLVRATNMMMGCGGCKNEFEFYFDEMTKKTEYFNGRNLADIEAHTKESLLKFTDYSTLNLENTQIEFEAVNLPAIHLKASGTTEVKALEKTLTNYLCAKLGMIIEVKLTIF